MWQNLTVAASCAVALAGPPDPDGVAPAEDARPVVELAICLDTSGSMDGLINSAREKIWAIVNDLALAEPTPDLRVALLTYGNDGQNPENGWVQIHSPFTDDLDAISASLFGFTTNGGTELVGRVIHAAAEELDWTPSDDALKLIVVAGNESADQDQDVPFRDAARQAIGKGIMINAIYCRYSGDDTTIEDGWREVARLADGQFARIDQDHGTIVIATPLDRELVELSEELNATYVPFGQQGAWGFANQAEQDRNAITSNIDAAATRAQTKAGLLYACSWDLVDACRLEQVKLAEVEESTLPEIMQSMTLEQRQAYLDEQFEKRTAIQQRIAELGAKREAYVDAERRRRSNGAADRGFDLAVRSAIRSQAGTKGFRFDDPDQAEPVESPDGAAPEYFVRVNAGWVANDIVGEIESAPGQGGAVVPTCERSVVLGQPDAEPILAALSDSMRRTIEALDGPAFVRVDGSLVRVDPAPVADGPDGAALPTEDQQPQQFAGSSP